MATLGFVETIYNINATGGAVKQIPCTIPCKKMEIVECQDPAGTAFAPQGLVYNLYDPTSDPNSPTFKSNAYNLPAEQINLGESNSISQKRLIGINAQSGGGGTQNATIPIKLISATGTQTWVRVREYAE